jgi:hypothetical protein
MARVLEEVIVIKLSRMVKDNDDSETVVKADQKQLIEDTIPTLIEEVIGDPTVIVEVADLD